ncbi:SIR2 family protein [Saccharibacillus sacchari]|uniref:SIR2 family protein n=1 Tax=Saccharibacillus sacchari TaxID=456493 RepID=UPI0004B0EE35|nr:SIR2 family protein [Saccharibacillus sacchari]
MSIENNEVADRLLRETKRELNSFLNEFSKQTINNESSLFIGSGVSRNSGHVTWGSLFEPLAIELEIEINENTDLYKIAQYYANKYTDTKLRKKVNDEIDKIKPGNNVLSELIDMNFNNIWTTNYDPLIEQELTRRLIKHTMIYNEKNLTNINRNEKVNIYKLNGDIRDSEKMIITKNDYECYEESHSLFLTFLKKELIANTFLFVGYSFTDALVLDCLSSINRLLNGKGNTHYAVMLVNEKTNREFEHMVNDLKHRYNIQVICITEDQIIPLLKSLNNKIKEKKVFISGAYDKVPESVVTQSDDLSLALVTSLFKNEYRISTGVGKRLGTLITGYSYQYLAEQGIQNKENYLSMRPFPFHTNLSEDKKQEYRINMQHDCSAAIFLFGQSRSTTEKGSVEKTGHYSEGVYQEFLIAKERNMIIIPVGSTGYEAEVIWNEVKQNINEYPYLSKTIDNLRTEKDPEAIAKLILHILSEAANNNSANQ